MSRNKIIAGILAAFGICLMVFLIKKSFPDVFYGNMLPSSIQVGKSENSDLEPEGNADRSDRRPMDYRLYSPQMFVGKWVRQDADDKDLISLPSGDRSGNFNEVSSLPVELIFVSDVLADKEAPDYKEMMNLDDYYTMMAVFLTKESGKNHDPEKTVNLCGIYDVSGSRLGLGFLGIDPEEDLNEARRREEKITEIHYDISWKGPVLTLSYKNSTARYLPSGRGEDPSNMTGGYNLGQPGNPDMDFHSINLKGDGTGRVYTVYGINVPVTCRSDKDGGFHVRLEEGQEWDYKEYLCSDNGFVLRKDDVNLIYASSIHFQNENYTRNYFSNLVAAYEFNGVKVQDFLGKEISGLIDSGLIMYCDPETRIEPGAVTKDFLISYNGAEVRVKACNISNIPLTLKECYICWMHLDLLKENIHLLSHSFRKREEERLSPGDTMEDLLDRYDNLVQTGQDRLCFYEHLYGSVKEDEIARKDGIVITEPADFRRVLLYFKDEGLTSCTVTVPSLYWRNTQYIIDDETADNAKAEEIRAAEPVRKELTLNLTNAFKDRLADSVSIPQSDEYGSFASTDWDNSAAELYQPAGTILIPWTHLFLYGRAELSEDGKELLNRITSCLGDCLEDNRLSDSISNITICSYTYFYDKKTTFDLSQDRAETVFEYLKDQFGKDKPVLISKLKPAGYGLTGYISAAEKLSESGPFIEIHCNLSPLQNHEAVYDEQPVQDLQNLNEHHYLDFDQEELNERSRAIAEKYKSVFGEKSFSIPSLGLEWKLPGGWHFGNDIELKSLNRGTAADLLNVLKPVYVMAAYSKDYGSMAHVRLYPGEIRDGNDEKEKRDIVNAMHRSILIKLEEEAEDVKEEMKTEKKSGSKEYESVFIYRDKEQSYQRTVKYIVKDDVLVTVTEIRETEETGDGSLSP